MAKSNHNRQPIEIGYTVTRHSVAGVGELSIVLRRLDRGSVRRLGLVGQLYEGRRAGSIITPALAEQGLVVAQF